MLVTESGITTEHFRTGGVKLAQKFEAEVKANQVRCSVLDSSLPGIMMDWVDRGLIAKYESPQAKNFPADVRDPGYWAPIKALVVTRSEDSILDKRLLLTARVAGEKPNVLNVDRIRFGDYTAFRFQPLDGLAPKGIGAVLGVSALRNHIVTIWPRRKKIALIPAATVTFPEAEQDYFLALADKEPEGVAEFIGKGPRRRLLDGGDLGGGKNKLPYVDANKLMVVAFVQHRDDHRVLAAKSFSLPQEDEVP